MKPTTTAVKNLIKNGQTVHAVPRVRAEWEHNRFSPIKSITVLPEQTPDEDWKMIYNLDSVGLPNRPRTGIAKARFDGNGKLVASGKYRNLPQQSRFYLATETDHYQYFSSTQKSQLVKGPDDGYAFDVPVSITVLYESSVSANKIVVGFETSYAVPKTLSIETTTNGTAWVTAASTATVDSKGQITLWRNDHGQWTSTPDYVNHTKILGVRVTVSSITQPYQHLDVIQVGARLENDLSDFVEDYDASFELSDRSLIAPLGKASANTGTLTLNNIDRRFNNENKDSLYRGLIGKKVKITGELSIDATPTAGSADERVREFTMYTDSWGGQNETSVTIPLRDFSVFLQEINVPKVFWEDMTVGAIVWQLMDILGFSNYEYTTLVIDSGQVVPYFWPEEDTTAWETISALAEGTQTAVFFDEYDVMQIRTRRALFGESKTPDWNFDAITNGQKLADVISVSSTDEFVVNKVDVNYKPTKYSEFNNGLPKMETVWEPEQDTVVLRSSPLVKDLLKTNVTDMWISQEKAAEWLYEATVNIRGELIKYKGKEYVWRKPGGGSQADIVYNQEDKERVDNASDPNFKWANAFSGRLGGKAGDLQRGLNGTTADDHFIRPSAYSAVVTSWLNNKFYPIGATQGMNIFNGVNTLVTPFSAGDMDYTLWKHEAVVPSDDTTYGIRFRIPAAQIRPDGGAIGGIWFAGDWGDSGYFLEVITTEFAEKANRQYQNEVFLVRMPGDAPGQAVYNTVTEDIKGWTANIASDVWYDLDVRHKVLPNGSAQISAYLDGVFAGEWVVPANQRPVSQGKFGMFVRTNSRFDVEYLYAVYQEGAPAVDDSTFFDLRSGGYSSGYIDRQWRYGPQYRTVNRGPAHEGSRWFEALNNRANYVLDEFGPVVHEVREFEVVFDQDNVPVTHSYLYLSNTSDAVCTNYWADPFGARFTLVNTSRNNAVISGDDTITFGVDNAVQQKFFIFGRALYQDDELKLTEDDEFSIRKNGVVDLSFDSKFVQNEVTAKDLASWVVEQWAAGSDELKVSVFGNPLVQIGDLVTMNYPVKDMTPDTHKYYIVSKTNSFQRGLETALLLRRARV